MPPAQDGGELAAGTPQCSGVCGSTSSLRLGRRSQCSAFGLAPAIITIRRRRLFFFGLHPGRAPGWDRGPILWGYLHLLLAGLRTSVGALPSAHRIEDLFEMRLLRVR
eukprot:8771800-Lingulodinium_polyedra.AAC.1